MIMPTEIGRDELRDLTGRRAQLVEVLPADEYDWAHLPGAVNLPLEDLDAGTGRLTAPGRSSCTATTRFET